MEIHWAGWYEPAWDAQPERYVEAGVVGWGRSRRLAMARDDAQGVKAFIGIQHYDPGRWNVSGEPSARFFLSLFSHGRTLSLRTYPTVAGALTALTSFHDAAQAKRDP
jgi:hypothetical protein